MIITMLRGIVFAVLGFMVLPRLIGVTELWTAIPAAELLTRLIIIAMETGAKNQVPLTHKIHFTQEYCDLLNIRHPRHRQHRAHRLPLFFQIFRSPEGLSRGGRHWEQGKIGSAQRVD